MDRVGKRRARLLLESMLRRSAIGEIRGEALLENEGDILLKAEGKLGRRRPRALTVEAVAGGMRLTVCGRRMSTDCLVGPPGCEPLLGQIVMESLDLICDPLKRTLSPRPESPYLATVKLRELAAA